jgi:hypothetical protein
MTETDPGILEGTSTATFSGIYHARIMAKGVTLRGAPFTREQTASVAVWKGGDNPYRPPRDSGKDDWCRFLACLLSEKALTREFEQQMKKAGVNLDGIRHCVQTWCGNRGRVRGNR